MSRAITRRRHFGRIVADRTSRRVIYLILAIAFAILIFFPRPYVARAKIVPQDTSVTASSTTSLLGALIGGNGGNGLGALLNGGRPTNDLYLIIGRSDSVTDEVIRLLKLVGPNRPYSSVDKAKIALGKKVDIRLLLGGVLEIETETHDADEARNITAAYEGAISRQLALFGQQIIDNKKRLVRERFRGAEQRVARAQAELAAFQKANNLQQAELQLGTALTQRAGLQARLQAKQVELAALQQARGPESPELMSARTELAALRGQLEKTVIPTTSAAGPTVAGVSALQNKYLNLYRDVLFQQAIYDVYQRSAEQVEVEELAAESASYIQVIDPAHLDPERQYNIRAVALLGALAVLAFFTEVYGPATGLFERRDLRVRHDAGAPAE